ncbi:E3 ubiquitin-protein ligase CHFR [Quillaja saponaria]|uniref:E3 ubiquitin-protein ligase CHFR n=1 Tax=Quillaja saponaria TaxID=32244 RepID=A0AAD7LFC5_QUISA|nr:E3 ubiquitin-protein ligase CHFR [Quillaja saponaria]
MVESGECSGAKPSGEVWAGLVPLDSRYSDVEIISNESVISSEISTSSFDKHNWCKIIRNSDSCSASIKNKSPNTILVDEAAVLSQETVVIKDGSEVISGPDREGFLRYRFNIMPSLEISQKKLKIYMDAGHAKCSICLNIWHDVVTVAPCLHNFCNGCFSEWLRRSQEKHSSVLCPQCRAVVQFVGRNHFLHNIAEEILEVDSSLRHSNEDIALLDSYASVRSNLIIQSGKMHRRKRARSPVDGHSDGLDLPCPQCGTESGGFRCNHNTVHLQCQACGGMMPSRMGAGVPQHCLGCDRAFCGAYWHALGIMTSNSYPVCSPETFRPISEYSISRIPVSAHEENQHEQNITESCIRQMGRTLQDVVAEWIAKFNSREIDRTSTTLNHAEIITANTHVCSDCYDKLVSFLLYWFRISIPKYCLPPDSSRREDCWYGYACRTQHHNEEHARKRNHVCRPTRGS